ncbi:hypothetical protein [Pseudodesulfovibrio sp. zrk46]|uniref:hypothetical protein n=1 Tax=Pseudodesulfovibrio sp. zrk46 TaxID=2725288 RepID=UPI0014493029|nr:hypothetical protein [Pseudodesulfovibrio sp. zrk46]QJB56843.1 hypothetical protein HFN16_10690 [Pseudodesulfovibrio sp. zrk46]
MRLLENIILRVAENDRADFESLMQGLAKEISKDSDGVEVSFYWNSTLESDVCIQLTREVGSNTRSASSLGVRLAASLKSFGLVDHTCWVEWEWGD